MAEKLCKSQVLYVPPNKDESRKTCANCMMLLKDIYRCSILGPDIEVTRHMVCGYYLNGEPMTSKKHPPMRVIDPEYAGLIEFVGDGTSCDNCKEFVEPDGCEIVRGFIDGLGCCAAWHNDELEVTEDEVYEEEKTETERVLDNKGMFS